MRLPMKFGVSLANTTPLPSCTSQKCDDRFDQRAVGLGRGNQLQQPHIARRIKEVRAEPAAAEIVGETLRDLAPPAIRSYWS